MGLKDQLNAQARYQDRHFLEQSSFPNEMLLFCLIVQLDSVYTDFFDLLAVRQQSFYRPLCVFSVLPLCGSYRGNFNDDVDFNQYSKCCGRLLLVRLRLLKCVLQRICCCRLILHDGGVVFFFERPCQDRRLPYYFRFLREDSQKA